MSWMNKLAETYDSIIDADWSEKTIKLMPAGFAKQSVMFVVDITAEGEFAHAEEYPNGKDISMPVTAKAKSRTGSIGEPFPLAEQMKYLVYGDLAEKEYYIKDKNGLFSKDENGNRIPSEKMNARFNKYLVQLKKWCQHPSSPWQLHSLLKYMEKKTFYHDLEEKAHIETQYYQQGKDGEIVYGKNDKAFVSFSVEGEELCGSAAVQKSWLEYCNDQTSQNNDVCYVTGEHTSILKNHPKVDGNAKFISDKDNQFPFVSRGRFDADSIAACVSEAYAQKAYNAYFYLLENQGFKCNGINYIAWNTNGIQMKVPIDDRQESFWDDDDISLADPPDTFQQYTVALRKAANGYENKLSNFQKDRQNTVCLMGCTAATNGRMSITLYQELPGNDYVHRIEHWYRSCCWLMYKKDISNNAFSLQVCTPKIYEIAEAVLGLETVQSARKDSKNEKSASKIVRELQTRILNCILNRSKVPDDIVSQAFHRVCNPMSYRRDNQWDRYSWLKSIEVTCALIFNNLEQTKDNMVLETSLTDRDYLFGRLLAVADIIECETKEGNNNSPTNAINYMTKLVQKPVSIWGHIHQQLIPYLSKLGNKAKNYLNEISQIEMQFAQEDRLNESMLGVRFIQGFYLERQALLRKHFSEIEHIAYRIPQNRCGSYGALLAVLDTIENQAKKDSTTGTTHSMQLMNACQSNPQSAISHITNKLVPYMSELGNKLGWYLYLAGSITYRLQNQGECFKPLDQDYLNSFYCLRACLLYGNVEKQQVQELNEWLDDDMDREKAYGILLGIAHMIERRYRKETNEDENSSQTNAIKLLTRMQHRPFETWEYLYQRLSPYTRMAKKTEVQTIAELNETLKNHGWDNDQPLTGEYLYSWYTVQYLKN